MLYCNRNKESEEETDEKYVEDDSVCCDSILLSYLIVESYCRILPGCDNRVSCGGPLTVDDGREIEFQARREQRGVISDIGSPYAYLQEV